MLPGYTASMKRDEICIQNFSQEKRRIVFETWMFIRNYEI